MKFILRPLMLLLFLQFFPVSSFSANNPEAHTAGSDSIPKQSTYESLPFRIGITSGWKTPYGLGVDVSILSHRLIDINFGCGYSITGVRIGMGSRIYPWRDQIITPMLGLFLSLASGQGMFSPANISGYHEGDYYISPFYAAEIEGGLRFRLGQRVSLECAIGYTKQLGKSAVHLYFGNLYPDIRPYLEGILNGRSVYLGVLIILPNIHVHLK